MCPNFVRKQAGIALPLALFVIIIVGLLVGMTTILQQQGSQVIAMQVQSNKAFYAAESAAQIGLASLIAGTSSCSGSLATVNFPNSGNLRGCRAALSCNQQTVAAKTVSTLESRAVCGSGLDLAKRSVKVRY